MEGRTDDDGFRALPARDCWHGPGLVGLERHPDAEWKASRRRTGSFWCARMACIDPRWSDFAHSLSLDWRGENWDAEYIRRVVRAVAAGRDAHFYHLGHLRHGAMGEKRAARVSPTWSVEMDFSGPGHRGTWIRRAPHVPAAARP